MRISAIPVALLREVADDDEAQRSHQDHQEGLAIEPERDRLHEHHDPEADQHTIFFISEFLAGLGLNTRLRNHGVKPEQLDALVAQAIDDPCHKTNAAPVAEQDLRRLYEEVI